MPSSTLVKKTQIFHVSLSPGFVYHLPHPHSPVSLASCFTEKAHAVRGEPPSLRLPLAPTCVPIGLQSMTMDELCILAKTNLITRPHAFSPTQGH